MTDSSNYSPTGKREDFFWAVVTAAATTLVVKLAEWAIEEAREKHKLFQRKLASRRVSLSPDETEEKAL